MNASMVWGGLTQDELDAAYNNMAAVSDSAARVAGWNSRSQDIREEDFREEAFGESHAARRDLPYGEGARHRIDLFETGRPGAPLFVFIHGGWWQRNSKETFSCMAAGPMAAGFDVALIGYTLAPEARLTRIVAEIHMGLDLVGTLTGAGPIILGGWSAGGHLTAMAMGHPLVAAGLSMSGVFDLEPIRLSYINDKLGLDEAEAKALSPQHLPAIAKPLIVACGDAELPELRRQSRQFSDTRIAANAATQHMPLEDHDHFSILDELEKPDGQLVGALRSLAVI